MPLQVYIVQSLVEKIQYNVCLLTERITTWNHEVGIPFPDGIGGYSEGATYRPGCSGLSISILDGHQTGWSMHPTYNGRPLLPGEERERYASNRISGDGSGLVAETQFFGIDPATRVGIRFGQSRSD